MINDLEKYKEKIFEDIKHVDKNGVEYWKARELQKVLGYKEWGWFSVVIEKAQIACSKSNNDINANFGVYSKIVKVGISNKNNVNSHFGVYTKIKEIKDNN